MKSSILIMKLMSLFVVFASALTVSLASTYSYHLDVDSVGSSFDLTINFTDGSQTFVISGNGSFELPSEHGTPVSITINGTTIDCGTSGTALLLSTQPITIDTPEGKWDNKNGRPGVLIRGGY